MKVTISKTRNFTCISLLVIAILLSADTATAQKAETDNAKPLQEKIYTFVEEMPKPAFEIADYIAKNIHYPDSAVKNHIEGSVIVKFIVNKDGTVSDVSILRGIGAGCDEEAIKAVSKMPKWQPGKQNGVPVKVYYTLPISFKLPSKKG